MRTSSTMVWCRLLSWLVSFWVILSIVRGSLLECDDNKQVNATKFTIDSDLVQIVWDGKAVFILTTNSMYKSLDEGVSWVPVELSSSIRYIYKTAGEDLVFLGPKIEMWNSRDDGKTINRVRNQPPLLNVAGISSHPVRRDWLLVIGDSKDCQEVSKPCYKSLYMSKDLGDSWSLVSTYVWQYSWGNAGQRGSLDADNTVYYSSWENTKDTDQDKLPQDDAKLYKQVDGTRAIISDFCLAFLFTNHKVLWLAGDSEDGLSLRLYVSLDGGRTISPTDFPYSADKLRQHSYFILDTTEGTTFLNVMHENYHWGHLYSSDAADRDFSLSLDFNHRTYGAVDFQKVQGISGVYVANQLEHSGNSKTISLITWDKGGEWQRLAAPQDTLVCNPAQKEQCSLHLYGWTSFDHTPLYSMPSAIGIVLGLGNVGSHLGEHTADTFVSRDAGVTWAKVTEGSTIYEFGDHGGILVMADNTKATTKFSYSWNEGLSTTQCRFSDVETQVYNIMSGQGPRYATTQNFIMFGREVSGQSVLYHLNFSSMHERKCRLPDNPLDPQSDYEMWSPTPYSGKDCLLGRQESFARRKPFAECYNGEDFDRKVKTKNCLCTREDYTCDYCYDSTLSDDNLCVISEECASAGWDPAVDSAPANCSGTFAMTQGYRLVVGDTCIVEGGTDLLPKPGQPCPDSSTTDNTSGSSVFLYVFFGVLLGGLGLVLAVGSVVAIILVSRRMQGKPGLPYQVLRPDPNPEEEEEEEDHLPQDTPSEET